MKMLDKDFDQLFNAQLGDLEVEPSAELWGKIAPQIPGSDAKRSGLMPFMRIAATLIAVLGIGLLFMPKQDKIPLHGNYDPAEATKQTASLINPSVSTADPYQGVNISAETPVSKPALADVNKRTGQKEIVEQVGPPSDIGTAPADPAEPIKENTVAVVDIPTTTTVSHIESVKPNITSALANNITKDPKPAKIITVNNPEPKTTEVAKRPKARGISGFLNAVIAKVDKRDDKIIQFGTDDDDNDIINVTSVNLGPIKVKKQE